MTLKKATYFDGITIAKVQRPFHLSLWFIGVIHKSTITMKNTKRLTYLDGITIAKVQRPFHLSLWFIGVIHKSTIAVKNTETTLPTT